MIQIIWETEEQWIIFILDGKPLQKGCVTREYFAFGKKNFGRVLKENAF